MLTNQDDYTKIRNYWKYLKAKLKKENSELVSTTTQLKLLASDGKRYLTDMLDYNGIIALGKEFPKKKQTDLLQCYKNAFENTSTQTSPPTLFPKTSFHNNSNSLNL